MEKYRENGKNHTFGNFDPLNGIFHANFAPWPQEDNTRDILSQISKIKILTPQRERFWKEQKMSFFSKSHICPSWSPWMVFLMLILNPDLKKTILETFQAKCWWSKFSPLAGGDWKGPKMTILSPNRMLGPLDPPDWLTDYISCYFTP